MDKKKVALLSGITGQDGSYLAELLLSKGYIVHGIKRRSSSFNTSRIDHLYKDKHEENNNFFLHYGDLSDSTNLIRIIKEVQPDEIYNLGAQSHVKVSFDSPEYTGDVTGMGTLRILEAIRILGMEKKVKFYNACHDKETKVFTNNGIKSYDEINIDEDLVITINEKTHEMEMKPISKVISYDYDGDMIQVKNKRIDQLLTPNHKMILKYDDINDLEYIDADSLKSKLKYSRNSHISLPKAKFSEKEANKVIDLRNYFDFSDISKNHFKNLIYEIETNDLLYLLGIYIGDGYLNSSPKGRINVDKSERNEKGQFTKIESSNYVDVVYKSSYINFAIPENDKSRERVISTLEKCGIDFHLTKMTVGFSSFVFSKVFSTCGNNVVFKRIPEWVYDLPCESLNHLGDGLIGSDGHKRKNRMSYTTISYKLANDVVRLYTKLGNYCVLNVRNNNNSKVKMIKGRVIGEKLGFRIAYNITINYNSNHNKIYNDNISSVKYNDKVWCLEVKDNHNFLVIRNGKISFSGNCSSEIFGKVQEIPQKETTPFYPRSPYGVAKLYAHWITINYRESYDIFACSGILFNHESKNRAETFVTRKITMAVAKIFLGLQEKLYLGNLDAERDWGHAKDYMYGAWLMMQQDKPDDYILATNRKITVRRFVELAFNEVNIDIVWKGVGVDEKGYNKETGDLLIEVDSEYFRPTEVDLLIGDYTKAKTQLGWEPTYTVEDICKEMVQSDLELFSKDKYLIDGGFKINNSHGM